MGRKKGGKGRPGIGYRHRARVMARKKMGLPVTKVEKRMDQEQAKQDKAAIRSAMRPVEGRPDSPSADANRRLDKWNEARWAAEREPDPKVLARQEAIRRYAAGDDSALDEL